VCHGVCGQSEVTPSAR